MAYTPTHPVRFVTAASLFDGHDAAINIMRRILQASGAEVVHLGHNRSVQDVVDTAIQEDVQGIAVSSYQGGHVEYFKYMYDLLKARGAGHIKIFGGGGGVIVPAEIEELHAYGITRIFSPEDGMTLGLQGMIDYMLSETDFELGELPDVEKDADVPAVRRARDPRRLARTLTRVEQGTVGAMIPVGDEGQPGTAYASASGGDGAPATHQGTGPAVGTSQAAVVGITGTGGAGKSTLTDELVRRFLNDFGDVHIAILSVDPTRRRTGGALLGDRIRMNALYGIRTVRPIWRAVCEDVPVPHAPMRWWAC